MERDWRQGRGSRGVTLVELLAAAAILALLTLVLTAGLNAVVHCYHTMISRSERELLLSTASNAVTEELRGARSVTVPAAGSDEITYFSAVYGSGAILMTTKEGERGDLPPGRLAVKRTWKDASGDDVTEYYGLLPSGAYGKDGVYAVELTELSYADKVFTFTLTVREENYGMTSGTFAVRCLMGV